MEEFERQEQIQRKEEHEEVHRKENGTEGGSGGRRKKEDKEEGSRSVRMIEDEGRSTRMTGDEGRSTQVSSPLRDASPPRTCAPDLPDGPTQSGSGRRREKDLGRKRGEGEALPNCLITLKTQTQLEGNDTDRLLEDDPAPEIRFSSITSIYPNLNCKGEGQKEKHTI